jgi:hypothetical protein
MKRVALAVILILCGAAAASAQVFNGDFATSIVGWTLGGVGVPVSWHPTVGNPGGSAYFYGAYGGNGSMEQVFQCGGGHGDGNCDISLEYRYYVSGGAAVEVVVSVDNIDLYTANHSVESALWNPVTVAVPCGLHTIKVTTNTITMGTFFGQWSVFLDNVQGLCTAVVPEETQDWGSLKAIYR